MTGVADNTRGLATVAAVRFIVVAASVKPARRVRNELPIPFREGRPICGDGERLGFCHQCVKSYRP